MINRRGLITGLISLAAAPAIVRASSLMPVKVVKDDFLTIAEYYDAILKPMIDDLVKRVELDIVYGSGGYRVESVADGIDVTPIHNYLKLDQFISTKNVDPIKIIDAKDYEV